MSTTSRTRRSQPTPSAEGPETSLTGWMKRWSSKAGIVRVEELVDPGAFEATAILEQLEKHGSPPPVLFPHVRALNGEPSQFALAFNVYSSLPAMAATLGVQVNSWAELNEHYVARSATPHPPKVTTQPSVQENVREKGEVDLRILPWTRHVQTEGGAYFTPIVVARAPAGGRYNLSWNRCMYLDPTHIAVHISPRHLWGYHRQAEEANEDLPIAIVLGHHPAFNLAAAALTSIRDDEYGVAGALVGEPIRIARSVTFGDELLIPADAEIVLEGRLLAGRRAVEGPFGEYLRYLGPQKLSHVFAVDAMTWRSGATVLEIFASHLDHFNACVAIEASVLATIRAAIPQVTGISWFRGNHPTTVIIAIRKSSEGQPTRAALAAMAAMNIVKQVIIVDDDIDIEDPSQVLWAISTRLRADEDITIVNNLQGNLLDPSQVGHGKTSGLVMDATKPLGQPFPTIASVPAEAVARFQLDKYSIKGMHDADQ